MKVQSGSEKVFCFYPEGKEQGKNVKDAKEKIEIMDGDKILDSRR